MAGPPASVHVEDLIDQIAARNDTPLDRIADGVTAGESLNELADALISHSVEEAREGGATGP